jgi:hypothetical protein
MGRHRFALMDTTTITRILARRTATTGRIGSTAACLLELDRGSTDFTGAAATGAVVGAVVIGTVGAIGAAGALAGEDVDSKGEAVLIADAGLMDEVALDADTMAADSVAAVDSVAIAVGSTVEVAVDSMAVAADSTVEVAVGSMVEVAVGSMVEAGAMAAATGN